ncbi:unnamed protein product [Closterium sp. NIES-53]
MASVPHSILHSSFTTRHCHSPRPFRAHAKSSFSGESIDTFRQLHGIRATPAVGSNVHQQIERLTGIRAIGVPPGMGAFPRPQQGGNVLKLVVSGPVASPLGATMLSTLSTARGLQLAAVVDSNPEANGRDAGEVAGLPEPLELPVVADVIMVLASVAQSRSTGVYVDFTGDASAACENVRQATAFGLSSVVVGAHIPEDELSGLYKDASSPPLSASSLSSCNELHSLSVCMHLPPSSPLPSSPFPFTPRAASSLPLSASSPSSWNKFHSLSVAPSFIGVTFENSQKFSLSVAPSLHLPPLHLQGCIIAPTLSILSILLERAATQFAFHCSHAHIIESRAELAQAPSQDAVRLAQQLAQVGRTFNGNDSSNDPSRGLLMEEGVRVHSMQQPGLLQSTDVRFGSKGQTASLRLDITSHAAYMPGLLLAIRRAPRLKGLVFGLEKLL